MDGKPVSPRPDWTWRPHPAGNGIEMISLGAITVLRQQLSPGYWQVQVREQVTEGVAPVILFNGYYTSETGDEITADAREWFRRRLRNEARRARRAARKQSIEAAPGGAPRKGE